MRRIIFLFLAVCVPAVLAFVAPGCGGSDSTEPQPEACGIDLYTPTAGRQFETGAPVDIRWYASGGGLVDIRLHRAGLPVGTVVAGTENDGYFRWTADTFGEPTGSDYVLRVASTTDPACADSVGLSLLNVQGCTVALTVNPDTTLIAGTDFDLTWTSSHTTGLVDLELWKGNLTEEFVATIAAGTPDDGSFLWTNVDSYNRGTSSDYYLHIADPGVAGCWSEIGPMRMIDDVICSITVGTPIPGATLAIGDTVAINFEVDNASEFVKIRLYALATFVPGGYIADHVPTATPRYDWVVTNFGYTGAQNMYRIVVTDENDPDCSGRSGTLTIQ